MTKLCLTCKEEFKCFKERNKFCSPSCWYKFRSDASKLKSNLSKKCLMCENYFYKKINRTYAFFEKQKCCSDKCRIEHKKTQSYRDEISFITKEWYRKLGFLTPLYKDIRKTWEYRQWRHEVLKRDGHKCTSCSSIENLEVHHVIPFSCITENYYDLENGKTLCFDCHIKTESYGRKANFVRKLINQS